MSSVLQLSLIHIYFFHDAHHLVPYRDAGHRPGHAAVLDVQIAGADTGKGHLYNCLLYTSVVPYQIGHPVDLFFCHAGIRQELPHQRGTLLLLIFTKMCIRDRSYCLYGGEKLPFALPQPLPEQSAAVSYTHLASLVLKPATLRIFVYK